MPYIDKESRKEIDDYLDSLCVLLLNRTNKGKEKNGEVVYAIYKILKWVYEDGNFEIKSNALKVLESAKLEFYRRFMVPYEDKKINDNGDVE